MYETFLAFFSTANLSGIPIDTQTILTTIFLTCVVLYAFIWCVNYFMHKVKIKHLEVAMARFPNYADVRYKIAEAYYDYGDYDNAERYYRETLNIYSYNTPAKIKLAMLLLERKNDVEEAFKIFADVRFSNESERRAHIIIDNYLKEKDLYEKFHSENDPAVKKS